MAPARPLVLLALVLWATCLPHTAAMPSKHGAFLTLDRPPAELRERVAADDGTGGQSWLQGLGAALWLRAGQWAFGGAAVALEPASSLMIWRVQNPEDQPPPKRADAKDNKAAQKQLLMLIEVLIQLFVVLLTAGLYSRYKTTPAVTVLETDKEHSLDGQFKHGLFNCLGAPGLCCFSCFCPGIRWADSMRLIGLLQFTSGITIWLGVTWVCMLLAVENADSAFLSTMVMAIVLTYYRQAMREAFRMEATPMTVAIDCLSYSFCGPCALVQDARQVEEAAALDHDAVKSPLPLALCAA